MERIRTALLVAAAAIISVPTLAAAQDNDRHQDRRGGHEFSRPDRGGQPQHGNRGQRGPTAAPQVQQRPAPSAGQGAQRNFGGRPDMDRGNRGRPNAVTPQGGQRQDFRQRNGNDYRGRNFTSGAQRQYGTPTYNNGRSANDRRNWNDRNDHNRQNWNSRSDYGRQNWNNGWNNRGRNDWRNDRRYDWRSYRNQHRDLFRGHRYVPPRGYSYGYRSFSPGLRIDPFFYGQSYWLSDPWEYRLPPVYGTYRWIRYYDDVLLVDISSGIVVDVIPDFFL